MTKATDSNLPILENRVSYMKAGLGSLRWSYLLRALKTDPA